MMILELKPSERRGPRMSEASLPNDEDRSLTRARQVDEICNQFEAAWKRGPAPRVEDFLVEPIVTTAPELLCELILLDIHYRQRGGQAPRFEDYRLRFPALADDWLTDALSADRTSQFTRQ